MGETRYILPSHPTLLCEDRFSILDCEDLYVPFWGLLTKLLDTIDINSPAALVDVLETIAVVRRGRADSDYGFLKQYLSTHKRTNQFFDQVWPQLKLLALELPDLFPGSQIPILGRDQTSLVFSRRQIACLVVHHFLCTLTAPTWQDGFQDFHIWYSSEQPHAGAVDAYLTALFEYFFRLAEENEHATLRYAIENWSVTYTLHAFQGPLASEDGSTPLTDLSVLRLPESTTSPSVLGLPAGAAVISANRFVGFGRTGTQEEMHVGASPECCPAVLVTPPLETDLALVVTGAEAVVIVEGFQRNARCAEILKPDRRKGATEPAESWGKRTMLFMDALELDLYDRDAGLPDLQRGNVEREFRKAYTAFNSYQQSNRPPYSKILTGYWGCGTFGGNVGVKSLIQWCAGSFAGCKLTFLCSGEERVVFGDELEQFVNDAKQESSANEIMRILTHLRPEEVGLGDSVLEIVKSKMKRKHELAF